MPLAVTGVAKMIVRRYSRRSGRIHIHSYHARNETWWQVPVARDLFVTVTVIITYHIHFASCRRFLNFYMDEYSQ